MIGAQLYYLEIISDGYSDPFEQNGATNPNYANTRLVDKLDIILTNLAKGFIAVQDVFTCYLPFDAHVSNS